MTLNRPRRGVRTSQERRFADLVNGMMAQLGPEPSVATVALVHRAAMISLALEQMEVAAAAGSDFNLATYSTNANVLRRIWSP
jgi:hypothetical protein